MGRTLIIHGPHTGGRSPPLLSFPWHLSRFLLLASLWMPWGSGWHALCGTLVHGAGCALGKEGALGDHDGVPAFRRNETVLTSLDRQGRDGATGAGNMAGGLGTADGRLGPDAETNGVPPLRR